jgi:hypothetical protein
MMAEEGFDGAFVGGGHGLWSHIPGTTKANNIINF